MKTFNPAARGLRYKTIGEILETHKGRVSFVSDKPGLWRFRRARKPPKWKEAEFYFRRFRDPQMSISLPQVSCLKEPVDD